jgi:hypothetical protein
VHISILEVLGKILMKFNTALNILTEEDTLQNRRCENLKSYILTESCGAIIFFIKTGVIEVCFYKGVLHKEHTGVIISVVGVW